VKTIEMDKATRPLGECARDAGSEPLVVTEGGKPVAVLLLPLENADLETAPLSTNAGFLELIERSRSRVSEEGGLSSKEVRRQLGPEFSVQVTDATGATGRFLNAGEQLPTCLCHRRRVLGSREQ